MKPYATGALLAVLMVTLIGCASSHDAFYKFQETMVKEAFGLQAKKYDVQKAEADAKKQQAITVAAMAPTMDAGGKAAYAVATAITSNSSQAQAGPDSMGEVIKLLALQRPPETWDDKLLKWGTFLLQGAQIWAGHNVQIEGIRGNTDIQKSLHAMIAKINSDTAAAGAAPRPATYQTTISVTDSENVNVGSGSASQSTPTTTTYTLTCSNSTGPAGDGAGAGTTGTAGAGSTTGAPGGNATAAPVNCTVTR